MASLLVCIGNEELSKHMIWKLINVQLYILGTYNCVNLVSTCTQLNGLVLLFLGIFRLRYTILKGILYEIVFLVWKVQGGWPLWNNSKKCSCPRLTISLRYREVYRSTRKIVKWKEKLIPAGKYLKERSQIVCWY